jgi:tetratricopeptide (TPR) repeat protein
MGNAAARSGREPGGAPGSGSRDEDDSGDGNGSFDDHSERMPLKVNQDLLLYQAATMRNKAKKTFKRDDRLAMRLNAVRIYERAKAVDPSDGRAYVGMAQVLRALGDVDAARRCYQDGCDATGGDNAYVWQAWATLEAHAGDVAKARQLYDAATAADKTHAAAWHGWGMLEKSQGNFQRARDLLVKGVRLVPPSRANPHLYQSLGMMAAERGRMQEAREHFYEGSKTEAGRDSAALWHAWAMLEAREGKGDEARKLFQRGLGADSDNKYVWLSWAVFEAREGFLQRARSLLIKGCALNPGDAPLLQALARLEAMDGDMRNARTLFDRGAKLDPLHQQNWQAWAMAEWRAGHVDRARELFQRGVWVAPRSKNACRLFQAWGVLEEREGSVPLARQLYKCAVKSDPTSEKAWLSWALMEEKQGNEIRAGELRNLCVQQRAEEAVGQSDLSPAAMFGIDSALRPVLTSLAKLLGTMEAGGAALPSAASMDGQVKFGELALADREVVKAEPLYGVRRQKGSEGQSLE